MGLTHSLSARLPFRTTSTSYTSSLHRTTTINTTATKNSTTPLYVPQPTQRQSSLSTYSNRLLRGRPSPSTASLTPSQIEILTHLLSLPASTPLLQSSIANLGEPLSRSLGNRKPRELCKVHTWLAPVYIHKLMGVLAYEMGPQLEKLRTAPRGLVSAQTEALLVALRPYERTFSSEGETGGGASIDLRCAACKLSCFFQDEEAVSALIVCAKGRKHHRKPWPESLAWLQPVKGVDYEKKWKKQGRGVILDRIAVNQWRKGDLACDTQPVVGGHGPGEGCDFCDAKGAAEADDVALLDEAIAEEELDQALADEEETLVAGSSDEGCLRDEDERRKKEHNHSLKILLRKMGEQEDEDEAQETADRLRKAESWAESYKKMIGKRPQTMTTLAFERYDRHSHLPPLAEDGRSDVKIGDMLLDVPGDQ